MTQFLCIKCGYSNTYFIGLFKGLNETMYLTYLAIYLNFYWHTVDLQYCVSVVHQSESVIHVHTCVYVYIYKSVCIYIYIQEGVYIYTLVLDYFPV